MGLAELAILTVLIQLALMTVGIVFSTKKQGSERVKLILLSILLPIIGPIIALVASSSTSQPSRG